jgi:hypothetical protein
MKFVNTREAITKYNLLVKDFILLILCDETKIETMISSEIAVQVKDYLHVIQREHSNDLNY